MLSTSEIKSAVPSQLTLKQTINGEEIDRKCNASLLVYTDGHVILQKNVKDAPQWATVGGKVELTDKSKITDFASLDGLERRLIDLLRDQFKADKDATMATFAYAAIRETIEEIGGNNKEFFYNALLNKQATLVRVDRNSFGIPEANTKFWTEQFYIDFGKMPVAALMANLKASGKQDCQEIVAAPVAQLETKASDKPGTFITTFNGFMVRHTTMVVAKRIDALRQRIAAVARLDNTNDVLNMSFQANDPLCKADLGAGLYRLFLPVGKTPEPANWIILLGKRFNGQLKFSVGGAVDAEDTSFYAAAVREGNEEHFSQLPVNANTNCFAHDVSFKPKAGKPGTDGMLYYSFLGIEQQYTTAEINEAVEVMNQAAPVYFRLNQFFTDLSKATPAEITNDATQQTAKQFLEKNYKLPVDSGFNAALISALIDLTNGISTLTAAEFDHFAEANIRIHSEYSYFVAVPYAEYQQALQNRLPIRSITPNGNLEDVLLFGAEKETAERFMTKFEAERLKMFGKFTTPQFAASAAAAAEAVAAATGEIGGLARAYASSARNPKLF